MNIEQNVLVFKALGDISRLKIVKILLAEDDVCACQLLRQLTCKQSTLSHHMKILEECNIVISKKDGKWKHYKINYEVISEISVFLNITK